MIETMDDDQCASVTHPSVRLRGTENDYTPQFCMDPLCDAVRKDNVDISAVTCLTPSSSSTSNSPHMHCPFCVHTDVYHDPCILGVHYRVKHVDKGIDFAGLRILRCCSRCDIVGAIKGEKKFKGAHWHCYKCRNGFNRRDEAIKHYKTHFRNPLTTFQIHIAQEVNHRSNPQRQQQLNYNNGVTTTSSSCNDHLGVEKFVPWDESTSSQVELADCWPEKPVVVVRRSAPNGDDQINDDQIEVATSAAAAPFADDILAEAPEEDVLAPGENVEEWPESADTCDRVLSLERENEELRLRNDQMEQHYKDEIQQLKMQVDLYSKEVENLKQRERDLLRYLVGDSMCDGSQEMIANLQAQHTRLLQQHLLQVRQWTLNRQQESGLTVTTTTTNKEMPETPNAAHSVSFPSDVFTLILDGRGSALVTPTKLLLPPSDGEKMMGAEVDYTTSDDADILAVARLN